MSMLDESNISITKLGKDQKMRKVDIIEVDEADSFKSDEDMKDDPFFYQGKQKSSQVAMYSPVRKSGQDFIVNSALARQVIKLQVGKIAKDATEFYNTGASEIDDL